MRLRVKMGVRVRDEMHKSKSERGNAGPPHAPRFKIDVTVYRGIAETIVGVGEGKTKSAAQHAAAAMALVSAMPTTRSCTFYYAFYLCFRDV
jgi:dsRNA-specific ribonuclease